MIVVRILGSTKSQSHEPRVLLVCPRDEKRASVIGAEIWRV